jgi:protein arginine kinase activator
VAQSCDRCENPATVHLTEIRGGKKTERHLCEHCAQSLHAPQASKELQKLLKSFEPVQALVRQSVGEGKRACPQCGMTWSEFRQGGRFGCAHDYEVFGKEIEHLLKRIHGSNRYCGKAPGGAQVQQGSVLDPLAQARAELQTAIDAENYEEAARLRDEIRRMAEEQPAPRPGRSGDAGAPG